MMRERLNNLWHAMLRDWKQGVYFAGLTAEEQNGSRLLWIIYFVTPIVAIDMWRKAIECDLLGHDPVDMSTATPDHGDITIVCARCGELVGQTILY